MKIQGKTRSTFDTSDSDEERERERESRQRQREGERSRHIDRQEDGQAVRFSHILPTFLCVNTQTKVSVSI